MERNKFSLWSPVTASPQIVEDLAFSGYAEHQQFLEDIVEKLCSTYSFLKSFNGEATFDVGMLSTKDLQYIHDRCLERGIKINIMVP